MTYVFACGGTGGHIFPAISVAEEIRRRDPSSKVLFISGKKDIESEIFRVAKAEEVFFIDSAPYRGIISFLDPVFLYKLFKGFWQSRSLIRKYKPGLVAGFGGYVSFPVMIAAKVEGVRTLVHEQNVMPGKTNRWMARMADAVALSFSDTKDHFAELMNIRITGNPIRTAIENGRRDEALSYFGFDPALKTLLILGGSQGAESINRLFLDSLPLWPPSLKQSLQVLHLCGILIPSESERISSENGVKTRAFSFFERMDLAYAAADCCVGRAGATFLAEIEAKQLPALLIPYPYGDGHQRYNAEWYVRTGLATLAEQKELSAEKFMRALECLILKGDAVKKIAGSHEGRVSARERLTDYIQESSSGATTR